MITPHTYVLLSNNGTADNRLNAFDSALQSAKVADFNFIKVSSILPVECRKGSLEDVKCATPGSFMFCVMSKMVSEEDGATISSAIACAKTNETVGVITEYSGKCSKDIAVERAIDMARKMANKRNATISSIDTTSSELIVNGCGCCVSLCLLLY